MICINNLHQWLKQKIKKWVEKSQAHIICHLQQGASLIFGRSAPQAGAEHHTSLPTYAREEGQESRSSHRASVARKAENR
jgi:hypothetical protein